MKRKKNSVGTFPITTHIHDGSISWFGKTLLKCITSNDVKLVLRT